MDFEKEIKDLKDKLIQNLAQLQSVTGIAVKLEKRIYEMESSIFWRARLASLRVWQHFKRTIFIAKDNTFWFERLRYFLSKYIFKSAKKVLKVVFKNLYLMLEEQAVKIVPLNQTTTNNQEALFCMQEELEFFEYKPLISIVMPVFNTNTNYLKAAIDSVREQHYTHWELCIADDCSTDEAIRKTLEEYRERDERIKIVYREKQGHISACSNSAIDIAQGEYIALLDHDDVIEADALYQVIRKINLHPEADFIYSDEDKLKPDGSFIDAYHKPDWSPDSFLSRNYITHFAIIRKNLITQLGGFREGFEGSQDYDLFLRITELTKNIFHVPKILYHWRIHSDSTALYSSAKHYAYEAAYKALEEAINRRQLNAIIDNNKNLPGYFTLRYKPSKSHKVSIIIPTKDKANILKQCLDSIFTHTNYSHFEVLVVSNNSTEESLFSLLKEYKNKFDDQFTYYENNTPFNFSALMNDAAAKATGDILLFLNNDTEIIQADWLDEMIGQAERSSIGAVGCKLLYPNNTVQHAGVVVGLGGAAGHVYVGEDRNALGYFCGLNTINNYSAVTGACLMCRRSVFEEVGGFDEKLKVEFNDTDFCLKLIDKGYYNIYLPQVELYHHESLSRGYPLATSKSSEVHSIEATIFIERWKKYIKHDPCFNINFSRRDSNFRLASST